MGDENNEGEAQVLQELLKDELAKEEWHSDRGNRVNKGMEVWRLCVLKQWQMIWCGSWEGVWGKVN